MWDCEILQVDALPLLQELRDQAHEALHRLRSLHRRSQRVLQPPVLHPLLCHSTADPLHLLLDQHLRDHHKDHVLRHEWLALLDQLHRRSHSLYLRNNHAMQNIYYGITEQELRTWPMQQYLIKVPEREFQNNVGQGFSNNLISSISAAFGIPGFESQKHELPSPLAFPPIEAEKTYRINWSRAYIYLAPLLPTHKNRQQIL